ncbi:MAG: L,D-transpeptidase family protein [Sphingomicrobium sp.]
MTQAQRIAIAVSVVALSAAPVQAQTAPTEGPIASPATVSDSPIDLFYVARNQAPIWVKDDGSRAAAQAFTEILRNAALDGLADGPELAAKVEAAITANDDKTISAAWVRYVQALKGPVEGVSFGDPALEPKVPTPGAILSQAARATSLGDYVTETAAVNPLYAQLRGDAVKAGGTADPRVRATLERLRLIPAKGRAILVDIPAAKLMMIDDGKIVDSMKVIVGKPSGATPIIASTINYVTFNPVWHIPQDIARVRVAPVVIKRGVKYLTLARYQTVGGFGGDKETPIDPTTIDWKAVEAGKADVYVRQLSGPQNMMGKVKFGFVNDFGVFLHDTPEKKLFAKEKRFLSHGCIRLERPEALASWLLGSGAPQPSGDPEQLVRVNPGVPIFLSYLTAQPTENGTIAYADDVYGLDTPGASKAVMATAATAQ